MLNSVCLMGRLVADPELRTTASGVAVCSFRIAVDRNYQGKDQERKADFINIVAWRGTAEFVSRYFHKGSMIVVQGAIQTENYTDKDGNKRTSFDVRADLALFGESKGSSDTTAPTNTAPSISPDIEVLDTDEDLPF